MRQMNLKWDGRLTIENAAEVANLLRQLLHGKHYTFVSANETRAFMPEVRTSQQLETLGSKPPIRVNQGEESASLIIHDSYGIWFLNTHLVKDEGQGEDKEWETPYLVFEENQVTIMHRAPSGSKLYWVIAVEQR